MKAAADGMPLPSPTGRGLGIRPEHDLTPDENGFVHYGLGGLSVTPEDPMRLPRHRRPPEQGGTGLDPIWELDLSDLPPRLIFREDEANPQNHGFIEPAESMHLYEYEEAIVDTRGTWTTLPAAEASIQ